MSHSTSGFGDTVVAALVPVWRGDQHQVHLGMGVSIPTGSVEEGHHGMLTHYDMQLGSGTWDLVPSLTYRGATDRFAWGAQALATVRLESENKVGYRLGDVFEATTWVAVKATDWASVSARVARRAEGEIRGHYNRPHGHASPNDFQENYGGDRLDVGLGVNLLGGGSLGGWRLGTEVLVPAYQKVNGVALRDRVMLHLGVSKSW